MSPLFTDGLAVKIGSYELPLGRWGEEADVEFDHRLVENQRKHRWELKGTITANTAAAYLSALTAFKNSLDQNQNITVTLGGETIASLTTTQCADGPLVKTFRLPNSNDKFAQIQPVEIVIEAVEETASGNTLTDRRWTKYRTDADGRQTISIRGEFRTKKGVSAQTVWTGKIPSLPTGYLRETLDVEYDDQNRDCKYSTEDKQIMSGSIETEGSAEVSEEYDIDDQGKRTARIYGFYTGATAAAKAEGHRPDGYVRLLHETRRTNLMTGRVDFSYEWIDMDDGDILSWRSTVVKSGGHQAKEIICMAGTSPFIISGAAQPVYVDYNGSAEAKGEYPDQPDLPYDDEDLLEAPVITREDPTPVVKRLSWSYRFVFPTDPGGPAILARPN